MNIQSKTYSIIKIIFIFVKMNKINFYILNEIIRGFLLVLFIFLSIAWLLQFTRLMSISNLLQIDTLSILTFFT